MQHCINIIFMARNREENLVTIGAAKNKIKYSIPIQEDH